MKFFEELLNSSLKKLPKYQGVVFRGIAVEDDEIDRVADEYRAGRVLGWLSFTSSTKNRAEAYDGNIIFIIHSENGRVLDEYADNPSQEEVLFQSRMPRSFPEVPPTAYSQTVGIGHVVESMMQMQQSIGELKATVSHLKTASDKQSTKLDSISHRIYAAGVVLTVVLGFGGFFLNKIWDGVFTLLKAGTH